MQFFSGLLGVRGIRFMHGDSRAALVSWLESAEIGVRPMVYLGAHWYADQPLRKEIELTIKRGNCVAVIDDCRVEADPEFGYDREPFLIALASIADLLPADRVIALQPSHAARAETGLRRGATVLLVDLPLPAGGPGTFAPVAIPRTRVGV